MIPAFVSDMQSRNLSPESIRSYAYILRQALVWAYLAAIEAILT